MTDHSACDSCDGRGWKYVSPRRGLVASSADDQPAGVRTRGDCLRCDGTGEGGEST